jgi:hypothetical protein
MLLKFQRKSCIYQSIWIQILDAEETINVKNEDDRNALPQSSLRTENDGSET